MVPLQSQCHRSQCHRPQSPDPSIDAVALIPNLSSEEPLREQSAPDVYVARAPFTKFRKCGMGSFHCFGLFPSREDENKPKDRQLKTGKNSTLWTV